MYVTPRVNRGAAPAPWNSWASTNSHTVHEKSSVGGVESPPVLDDDGRGKTAIKEQVVDKRKSDESPRAVQELI